MHEGHADMVAAIFSAKASSGESWGWGCDMLRWVRWSDKDGGERAGAWGPKKANNEPQEMGWGSVGSNELRSIRAKSVQRKGKESSSPS